MDMITLAMAKAYTDSKGGYIDKQMLTYDGNTDGMETISYNAFTYVRIGDAIDYKTVTEITIMRDGETTVLGKDQIEFGYGIGAIHRCILQRCNERR